MEVDFASGCKALYKSIQSSDLKDIATLGLYRDLI